MLKGYDIGFQAIINSDDKKNSYILLQQKKSVYN